MFAISDVLVLSILALVSVLGMAALFIETKDSW